jgi:predicted  nucleic acid-binding Zn-ribbon protein
VLQDSLALLHGELQQLQTRLQESQSSQENQKLTLTEQVRELGQQRGQLHQEVSGIN